MTSFKSQAELDAKIKQDLAHEDLGEAFKNILETIKSARASEDLCAPRMVILTMDNCKPCEDEEALRAAEIEAGLIQKIDIDSEEGQRIAALNEIELTPTVLLLDCQDKAIEVRPDVPENA